MLTLLKRHFWLFSVPVTLAASWFTAAAAGEFLLGSLTAKVDLSQAAPGNLDQDAGTAPGFEPDVRTVRLDDLLGGNLFDLPAAEPVEDAGTEEIETEAVEPPPPVDPGSTIPPCSLPLKVVAVLAAPEDRLALAFATIEMEGRTAEYRIGQDVGGSALSRITWNRVYLTQGDGRGECFMDLRYPDLGRDGGGPPPPPAAEAAKPPENKPPEGNAPPQDREGRFAQAVRDSVETVSETERNIQRSLINTILDNQDLAMRQARVMPHEQGGEVVGFKVYGIRRESLFGTLGMENGDLIQTINGIPMTGADKALQAYGRLRMADRIEVSVTRRGQQMTLVYNIR